MGVKTRSILIGALITLGLVAGCSKYAGDPPVEPTAPAVDVAKDSPEALAYAEAKAQYDLDLAKYERASAEEVTAAENAVLIAKAAHEASQGALPQTVGQLVGAVAGQPGERIAAETVGLITVLLAWMTRKRKQTPPTPPAPPIVGSNG